MPAKSEKQRKLMGMVYAAKKGDIPYDSLSEQAKKIYNTMNKSQLRDFTKKGRIEDEVYEEDPKIDAAAKWIHLAAALPATAAGVALGHSKVKRQIPILSALSLLSGGITLSTSRELHDKQMEAARNKLKRVKEDQNIPEWKRRQEINELVEDKRDMHNEFLNRVVTGFGAPVVGYGLGKYGPEMIKTSGDIGDKINYIKSKAREHKK